MRTLTSALLIAALLTACGDNFREVQNADTIEAYEAWMSEASDGNTNYMMATIRLEELYLENAKNEATLEAYDRYLARWQEDPKARLVEKALEGREEFLWNWAEAENTAEGWQKFLDEYPKAKKKKKQEARRRITMAEHRSQVEIGPVETEPVNLAENPDGPLDGFLFTADVVNNTGKVIETLNMQLEYLDSTGAVIAVDKWPLVAPRAPGGIPIEEEWKVPVKAGETRAFTFMDMAPEVPGWSKKVRLVPLSIKFVEEE